jgi:hypothetical protein
LLCTRKDKCPRIHQTTINELWKFAISTYVEISNNMELYGTDSAISLKARWKEMAPEAISVYQTTIGNVSPTESICLHEHKRVDEILKWTKEHLDAYLASADVIIKQ